MDSAVSRRYVKDVKLVLFETRASPSLNKWSE